VTQVYRYSLIQYVPDPVRGERLNVGVAVAGVDSTFFATRFIGARETGRLKRLGFADDFAFLRAVADEFGRGATQQQRIPGATKDLWDLDALEAASREWANTVQVTAPRPVAHGHPETLLDALFAQLVADPSSGRHRARDRRWIKRHVRDSFKRSIARARPDVDIDSHVRRNVEVPGAIEAHRFDFEVVNGKPLQLIETLAVEGADTSVLHTQVAALAWMIDDVRKRPDAPPMAVLTIGKGSVLKSAEHVYQALGAELVRESDLDAWLDSASDRLLTALSSGDGE
jgi:hypothetical protein